MEKTVNVQMLYLFGILLALSVGCSIGSLIRNHVRGGQMWYLLGGSDSSPRIFVEDILTFIILFNNLLPISCASTLKDFWSGKLIEIERGQTDCDHGSRQVPTSFPHQF